MNGEDVLIRGSYNFMCGNITHRQSSRMVQINVATSMRHNNSNLGGKKD